MAVENIAIETSILEKKDFVFFGNFQVFLIFIQIRYIRVLTYAVYVESYITLMSL
jgi:hypothetical protein